ncbi:MAG: 2-hydroxycarboxylate transporter family protein [Clostridium sp.]|nr:2-hydroxycarboxylate transporter family protein [Clostridium sp.]
MEGTRKTSIMDEKLFGLPLPFFAVVSVIVIGAGMLGKLESKSLICGGAVCMVVGYWLSFIADKVGIIRKTIGLAFVSITAAALVYFNLVPENMLTPASAFMNDTNFLAFYIAALLCGSILGMDRRLLIQAGARYFIPIIGGVALAYGLGGLAGMLVGMNFKETVMFVAAPIMGGGNGAGAVPMSEIYAAATGGDKADFYSRLMAMVTLGNWCAMLFALLLNQLGKHAPKTTGNGVLMEGFRPEDSAKEYSYSMTTTDMVAGLGLASGFYIFGRIANILLPSIHAYAFTIAFVAFCKIAGIIPERLEFGAVKWYRFMMDHFTIIIMGGVGLTMMDLGELLAVLTPRYVFVVFIVVLGAALGAGFVGLLVKFYFVESAITAGMCMANGGGNGDILVLSMADRMNMMSFAQISSRLGGALILVIQSILASMWL